VGGHVTAAIPFDSVRILANIISEDPGMVGLPIHIVDPATWSVSRSFGLEEGGHFNALERWPGYRHLTLGGAQKTVWTCPRNAYDLREWDLASGLLVGGVRREVDWFPPVPELSSMAGHGAPLPTVESIRLGEDGNLITLILLPQSDWEDHLVMKTLRNGMRIEQPDRFDNIYDTLIEIIDPGSGRLLMRQRFPQVVWGFLQDDLLFGVSEDDLGVPRVEIWKLDRISDNKGGRE